MKKLLLSFIALLFVSIAYGEELMVIRGQQEIWTESFGELEGDDNAVLFIHGCGSNALTWDDYMLDQFVDQGYFCIRFDQRNLGMSGPSHESFDFIDLVDDAMAILDAYGIKKVHLVGHSMGGMVSQFIAAHCPDRLHTVTLIATAPIGMTPHLEKPLSWSELKMTATAATLLSAPLPSDFEKALPLYLHGLEFFNGDYPVDQEMATEFIYKEYHRTRHEWGAGRQKHAAIVFEMMRTLEERENIFHLMHTPALIIHGDKDGLILPSRGGLALHDVLQDSELYYIPGMGHAFFHKGLMTDMCRSMMKFMEKHRGASPS